MKGMCLILPLLLSFILVSSSYGKIDDIGPKSEECIDKSIIIDEKQSVAYYREFNSSWFAVKISSEETVFIKQLYINVIYKNATRNSFFYYILYSENGTILRRGGWSISSEFYNDFFFHLYFGSLNITINDINRDNFSGKGGRYEDNITLPPGIYYLFAMHATHQSCKFRVWINATNITSLETTEGNETYLLDETDFLGKINIYSFNYSITWKGSVEIETNNTFIGGIFLDGDKGITKLKITLPDGGIKRVVVVDAGKEYILGDKKYLKPIIWSKGGKWKFEISGIESHDYPNIFLLFSDVKLP